jgi:hypothetical protein
VPWIRAAAIRGQQDSSGPRPPLELLGEVLQHQLVLAQEAAAPREPTQLCGHRDQLGRTRRDDGLY